MVHKPYGFKDSFYTHKRLDDCTGKEERVFNKSLHKAQAASRMFPPHLRVEGRKQSTMLMSHITKAAIMMDMESFCTPPMHHIINPKLHDLSAGNYDNLPELIEGDSGHM